MFVPFATGDHRFSVLNHRVANLAMTEPSTGESADPSARTAAGLSEDQVALVGHGRSLIDQNAKSRWSAMAEFDAAEADMAQAQTRPVDTVRAEEEELLESNKPARPSRGRGHQFPSSNRLATGGLSKVEYHHP